MHPSHSLAALCCVMRETQAFDGLERVVFLPLCEEHQPSRCQARLVGACRIRCDGFTMFLCRAYIIVLLRCLLLVCPVSAVAVAVPGTIASFVSALLEPYRKHAFIPWEVLDFLVAPAAASSLRWDLGLPVMMLCFSTVLPVRPALPSTSFWYGHAACTTLHWHG